MVSNSGPWELALPNDADSFSSKKVKILLEFGISGSALTGKGKEIGSLECGLIKRRLVPSTPGLCELCPCYGKTVG
ncbi:hypothetical protein AV530_012730 [Patagioenas fasciata monilis]|uniref:Uncharacterized protein n=1 Tax=Patagioenas fasciata monilis TaxID=372326 RepID=A0A1V4JC37_PATFA|nr:hypothetical protein AV530_012730 [Patagioenas fasciata monilis]